MWTPGGQRDHLTFAGLRGGGKGGSDNTALEEYLLSNMNSSNSGTTYTDTTTGQTYTSQADYNAAVAQDQANAAAASALATKQATETATENENTFQSARQTAYNNALADVMNTFTGQGVDPTQYMGYITPQLQSAYNSIPDLTSSDKISSYFPTSLGQTILNSALSDRRTQAGNAVSQVFTPTYAQNMIPTSTMDQPIQDLLNNQFNPLSTQLTNALNRGTLTQAGYNAATAKEAQDRAAAQSQLQTLGSNILTGYRSDLSNIASGAQSAASSLNLGQSFDPSSYASQGSQLAATDIGGFSGALQNAASNVTYGDITDLLNAGGVVQGAGNPTASNPAAATGTGTIGTAGGVAASTANDPSLDTKTRGLGSTGAF